MAFPGSPAIAPLPRNDVRGVVLVEEALHVSFCRSGDGQIHVWRWLRQEGESIWVRELHMDSEVQKTVGRKTTCCISAALKFHLWYERGRTWAFFSRFPALDASGVKDERGAAHLPEWRTEWRNPSMHLMTRSTSPKYVHCVEMSSERLTDDVLQEKLTEDATLEDVMDDAIQENLADNARDKHADEDFSSTFASMLSFFNELWPSW